MSDFKYKDKDGEDVVIPEKEVSISLSRMFKTTVVPTRRYAWPVFAVVAILLVGSTIESNDEFTDDGKILRKHFVKFLAIEFPSHKTTRLERHEAFRDKLAGKKTDVESRIKSLNDILHAKIYEQDMKRKFGVTPDEKVDDATAAKQPRS